MLGKGRGLLSVVLLIIVVWLGAYSVQYYTWTAPTQVTRTTHSITVVGFSTSVRTSGSENFGTHPTSKDPAVPASDNETGDNATIIIGENYHIHFTVTDADAKTLDNYFENLTINICVYNRGEENASPHDNLDLSVVVSGKAQSNIDKQTVELDADNDWDPVITVKYSTDNTSNTDNIIMGVYAEEAGSGGSSSGQKYLWKIPYEITTA